MKQDEIYGKCTRHAITINAYKILAVKPQRRGPFGTCRNRWENNGWCKNGE
jgi:hypothetical protein